MSFPELDQAKTTIAVRRMDFWLRFVILVQCVGLGGRYLFSSYETESDIYGWLYFDCDWSEPLAQSIDNCGSLITVIAGVMIFCIAAIRGRLFNGSPWPNVFCWLNRTAAVWIAIWMVLISLAHMMRTSVFAELVPAEHAVRYIAPLAIFFSGEIVFCLHDKNKIQFAAKFAITLLMLSASATFAAHGYKAVQCFGLFTDLILLSNLDFTRIDLSQQNAERLLIIVGVLDIVAAIALLLFRSRLAICYMAIWGFVTAASRMTAMGVDAWPEFLLRFANGGVPIAILLYFLAAKTSSDTTFTQNLLEKDHLESKHVQT